MSAQIVDSFEFCRTGAQVAGTTPVAEFKRLCADLADSSGELQWSFQGGSHAGGDPQLVIQVSGAVRLICQRCLTPFTQSIQTRSTMVLATNEVQADEIDARIDNDNIDVIVGSRTMDLMVLVEDDALLSLSLSPRHETCPGVAPQGTDDKEESPFAALRQMKQ